MNRLKGVPEIWTPTAIKSWQCAAQYENQPNVWTPVRPINYIGLCLKTRLQLAWRVFIGRYDVLDWKVKLEKHDD